MQRDLSIAQQLHAQNPIHHDRAGGQSTPKLNATDVTLRQYSSKFIASHPSVSCFPLPMHAHHSFLLQKFNVIVCLPARFKVLLQFSVPVDPRIAASHQYSIASSFSHHRRFDCTYLSWRRTSVNQQPTFRALDPSLSASPNHFLRTVTPNLQILNAFGPPLFA